MNHDIKLAVLSGVALGASVLVSGSVLFADPEEGQAARQSVDSQLLSGTERAEALQTEHGSTIPFHWMFESIVKVTRRIK